MNDTRVPFMNDMKDTRTTYQERMALNHGVLKRLRTPCSE